MKSNRRELLHLIAMGRMTPLEAERLILAWNDGREMLYVIAGVGVFAVISQILGSGLIQRGLSELMSAGEIVLHSFVSTITHIAGGTL